MLLRSRTAANAAIYSLLVADASTSESDEDLRHSKRSARSKSAKFATWLGHWQPEYDIMDQNELMLQARLLAHF